MLLIVIDDEKAEDQQAGENAAGDLRGGMKIYNCAGEGRQEEGAGGEDIPPAARGGIFGERFGGEDEFGARSRWALFRLRRSERLFHSR